MTITRRVGAHYHFRAGNPLCAIKNPFLSKKKKKKKKKKKVTNIKVAFSTPVI
ncbi:uncharacterized protein V6R79_017345 [Siganus canaliculatus]